MPACAVCSSAVLPKEAPHGNHGPESPEQGKCPATSKLEDLRTFRFCWAGWWTLSMLIYQSWKLKRNEEEIWECSSPWPAGASFESSSKRFTIENAHEMIWNGWGSCKRTLCTLVQRLATGHRSHLQLPAANTNDEKTLNFVDCFVVKLGMWTLTELSSKSALQLTPGYRRWWQIVWSTASAWSPSFHQGSPLASENKWISIEMFLFWVPFDLLNLRAEMCEHNCEWMLTGPADMSQNLACIGPL